MAPDRYEGRLELTWTNKDRRLLAYEDGSYVWVDPADYRVAEVRLLDDVGTVGDTSRPRERARDNLLIRGDALNALTSLTELPEFAREYVGKVKLVYIDPPFNTGQAFTQYDDALEHSVWLTMMRDRLVQIKKLLAPDGSVWVHLDDAEMAYCRVMMDEIFGRDGFIATVLWEKVNGRDNRAPLSTVHDYIVVYAATKKVWAATRNLLPFTDEALARYSNPDNDQRGLWTSGDMTAQAGHGTESQFYTLVTPSGRQVDPPAGSCWRFTEQKLRDLDADTRIWWGEAGNNVPRLKRFLSEVQDGLVPRTLWLADEVGTNDEAKKHIKSLFSDVEPFATPKPERLLERVIHIATNPGDIVLDCFVGSGTTAAVAHKMGRRWVAVERSREALEIYALPRLTRVVAGHDSGGITADAEVAGGGGFVLLDVAPSMFHVDGGVVVIADWATDAKLAEATAAQLGFEFEFDSPFVGRKGRSRLAVVDGLVNADVARLLVDALSEDELLTLCGTAVDPDAARALRELRRGSVVRKIPASILAEYRRPRWRAVAYRDESKDTVLAVSEAVES